MTLEASGLVCVTLFLLCSLGRVPICDLPSCPYSLVGSIAVSCPWTKHEDPEHLRIKEEGGTYGVKGPR